METMVYNRLLYRLLWFGIIKHDSACVQTHTHIHHLFIRDNRSNLELSSFSVILSTPETPIHSILVIHVRRFNDNE